MLEQHLQDQFNLFSETDPCFQELKIRVVQVLEFAHVTSTSLVYTVGKKGLFSHKSSMFKNYVTFDQL